MPLYNPKWPPWRRLFWMNFANIDHDLKWNQSRPMSKWVKSWIDPSTFFVFVSCFCFLNLNFSISFYFIFFWKSSKRIFINNLPSLKVIRPKRAKTLIQKVETFVWWGASSPHNTNVCKIPRLWRAPSSFVFTLRFGKFTFLLCWRVFRWLFLVKSWKTVEGSI